MNTFFQNAVILHVNGTPINFLGELTGIVLRQSNTVILTNLRLSLVTSVSFGQQTEITFWFRLGDAYNKLTIPPSSGRDKGTYDLSNTHINVSAGQTFALVSWESIPTAASSVSGSSGTILVGIPFIPELYCSPHGTTKKVSKLYGSINGTTKEVTKLYGSVGGVSKCIFRKQ